MLSDTILKALFDSMAAQVKALVAAYGRATDDTNTVGRGAGSQFTKVVAEFDTDNEAAKYLATVMEEYQSIAIFTPYAAQMLVPTLQALNRMVKAAGYTDINNFLQTSAGSHTGFKVHPYLREIWSVLAAKSVWPLSIDTCAGTHDEGNEAPALYTFESDGAGGEGAGTADGTAVDSSKYGDGLIQGWVPTGKSVTTGASMTVNGVDINGNAVSLAFTTTSVTGPNKMAIAGTTRFAAVTSVAETGTTLGSGDLFQIVFKDDRAPTLVVP